jgi:hypothetical protein
MKTMTIIKTCCALTGAAMLTASSAFATISGTGTATVNYNYSTDIFNVSTTATTGPGLGSFQTFCLNSAALITTPGTYNYSLSDSAVPGSGKVGNPDPISIGTAWLYSQFRMGSLVGYANTASVNHLLQQAIWWLEDDGAGLGGAANNSFIQAAETALSLDDTTIRNDANGAYGVFAMNMTDKTGAQVQPLLGMVPEPSTVVAGALLLLPFGVSTVRILRKSKA